ncbi:transcription factor of the MADS box [Malassezia cuniculi]|uniref:Transcription factor of the MADS box n=1 Tax=Malassezia cuniculi TaxID=948313 RepID=A0AAF0J6C8_9BASI|nr:transcription factor of the MADS box [Malassezia cuniculi]
MSNQPHSAPYTQPDMDMNGLLVASCRQDQNGQFPPIYDVPHGTIQLAQQFNMPRGNWPFPNTHPGMLGQTPSQQPTSPTVQTNAHYKQYQGGQYAAPASSSKQPRQEEKSGDAGKRVPVKESDGEDDDVSKTPKRRSMAKGEKDSKTGRRKIKIEFIDDDSRRHITFSKRKAGIMKKAYELATLTGTQVLLLVVSQTGLVYTFTTPKLEAVVKQPEGRNLIQECLNAPDPVDNQMPHGVGPSSDVHGEGEEQEEDENGEGEDDEEEDYFADGMQAQAFNAFGNDAAQFAQNPPLFHPGAVPQQPQHTQQVKRRRTNVNLAAAAAAGRSAAKEPMPQRPAQGDPMFMMPQGLEMPNGMGNHMMPSMQTGMPFYDGDSQFMYGAGPSKSQTSI